MYRTHMWYIKVMFNLKSHYCSTKRMSKQHELQHMMWPRFLSWRLYYCVIHQLSFLFFQVQQVIFPKRSVNRLNPKLRTNSILICTANHYVVSRNINGQYSIKMFSRSPTLLCTEFKPSSWPYFQNPWLRNRDGEA